MTAGTKGFGSARARSPRGFVAAALAISLSFALGSGLLLTVSPAPTGPRLAGPDAQLDSPSVQYTEAVAHAAEHYDFAPGDPVSVPYTPRAGDTELVDGALPVALPLAGSSLAGTPIRPQRGSTRFSPAPANALRREVYGFLPYWNVGASIDYDLMSTVAYFGIDLNLDGSVNKSSSGWSGWAGSAMTTVINDAHVHHTRVALTIESFAWGTEGAAAQATVLGSADARNAAATQIAAAVHDRGADGVNLDFEPIANGQSANFVTFVRQLRSALDAFHSGYELTFCGTGHVNNYDLANLFAPGGADNVFIMGYDFRTGSSPYAASIDPLTSPLNFDLASSIAEYRAGAPASKLILGLPYYGRAYSTTDNDIYAGNQSGGTYGQPASVPFYTAASMADTNGYHYDSIEQSAWTAYYGTYGGKATWRELYYDDVTALAARYDRINYWNLGGVGIWCLGYDQGHPELNQLLADKFVTDKNPPRAGIVDLAPSQTGNRFPVSWTGSDDWSGIASFDVQVSTDDGAWTDWLASTKATSGSYSGSPGHDYSFRVRATDGVGNVGAWNTTSTYSASPTLAAGSYAVARAVTNERAGPRMSAAVVQVVPPGTVFQVLDGPVVADDYIWYQISGPILEVSPVTPPLPGAWIAVGDDRHAFVSPCTPPNSTVVAGPLLDVTAGTPGLPVSQSEVDAGRTFSPDGDGVRDTITLGWTNQVAFDDVSVAVYRRDGTVARTVDLGEQSAEIQSWIWDGTDGHNVLPDGQYLLQVTARSGSTTYSAPAAAPFDDASWASFGITLDTTPSGTFYPMSPIRVLDTQKSLGSPGALPAGTKEKVQIAGKNDIPKGAIAITGTLSVSGAGADGYLRLGSDVTAEYSTINFPAGDSRANGVTVGLADDGSLSLLYVSPVSTATVQLTLDVTGYFKPGAGGSTFVPVTPARLVDTRTHQGVPAALASTGAASFQVASMGDIPANATAVTGTITVQSPTAAGYLTLAPKLGGEPATSSLDFPLGDSRTANVTVALGDKGRLAVAYRGTSGASVDFTFDVTGYFAPGSLGATFVPLTPERIADGRTGSGLAGAITSSMPSALVVRGQTGVPAWAVAVVGNATVTRQSAAGWLAVSPAPASNPVPILNFPTHDDRAAGFVCPLGPGGTLSFAYGGSPTGGTDVLVDIYGYFK